MVTKELLLAVAPQCPSQRVNSLVQGLDAVLPTGDITTPPRIAAFLAQAAHETCSFKYMEELWGPTGQQLKYDPASGSTLSRTLGNTQKGDGYRYRGRGIFMLTGRFNYRKFGQRLGLDLEGDPDLAARPDVAARLAVAYWSDRNLNALADANDFVGITRKINGGTNGLADRQRYWGLAQAYLALSEMPAQRFVLVDKAGKQVDWDGKANPYNGVTVGPELLAALDLAYPLAGGPWAYGALRVWRRQSGVFVLERIAQQR